MSSIFSHSSLNTSVLVTASVKVTVEPVGRWFEAYIRRRNRTTSASFVELVDEESSSEESEDEEFQIVEDPMIRTLDPKDWKVTVLPQTLRFDCCYIFHAAKYAFFF